MSTWTIENSLPIVNLTHGRAEPSNVQPAEGKPFGDHLQRVAEGGRNKPTSKASDERNRTPAAAERPRPADDTDKPIVNDEAGTTAQDSVGTNEDQFATGDHESGAEKLVDESAKIDEQVGGEEELDGDAVEISTEAALAASSVQVLDVPETAPVSPELTVVVDTEVPAEPSPAGQQSDGQAVPAVDAADASAADTEAARLPLEEQAVVVEGSASVETNDSSVNVEAVLEETPSEGKQAGEVDTSQDAPERAVDNTSQQVVEETAGGESTARFDIPSDTRQQTTKASKSIQGSTVAGSGQSKSTSSDGDQVDPLAEDAALPAERPVENPTAKVVDVPIEAKDDGLQADADTAEDDAVRPVEAREGSRPTGAAHVGRTLERLINARSAQPTADAQSAELPPAVDAGRFVSRVASALQRAEQREGPLHLRLSPPELGSLRIELTVKQGTLTANLETETGAARKVLLDNLPALRERLADQGIRVEKFDVDVRDDGSQGSGNQGAQQRQPHDPSRETPTRGPKFGRADEPQQTSTKRTRESSLASDDGLDVRV